MSDQTPVQVEERPKPRFNLFRFLQEVRSETNKVTWPTRKETMQTTAVVFGFVLIMAIFLWLIDASLLWAVRLLMGQGDS